MAEINYEFRERMLEVHKPHRRMPFAVCKENQIEITPDWVICLPADPDRVLYNAARDLEDYFTVSMELSLRVQLGGELPAKAILYQYDEALTDGRYRLAVTENRVVLAGGDSRAAAQAGYFLEDLMNLEEGPFLSLQDTVRTPLYTTRMVHSGYGLDQYPDNHMKVIAHTGINALLVFVKGINETPFGYQDFNDLIYRAAGYGLDVYVYSYLKNTVYPEGEEGQAFYDRLYGDLFRSCPGFKGVILVGESCEFPSRDPRTCGRLRLDNMDEQGNKLDPRPLPGWFPCSDYPLLINMIKTAVQKVKPEAELVLWSYNWGKVEEELRLPLIQALPKDVTLQATFEMFEYVEHEGVLDRMADYCLYFEGPGQYFVSEAKEAARQGLKLYSMTNTGGATWDMGTIPYVPAPYQWLRRHKAMHQYHDSCGLCGIMESHHYGIYPSFITDLAKWMFHTPDVDAEALLRRIAVREFSEETADRVLEAWQEFSQGIRRVVTNKFDQYGPYRVGPSFPLLMEKEYVFPSPFWAHHGNNKIVFPLYPYPLATEEDYKRIHHELRYAKEALAHFDRGADLLEEALLHIHPSKQAEARRMAGLGRFMARAVETAIHTKEWHIARTEGNYAALPAIAEAEIANAERTVPLVEYDSRLGYEPSMEYMCDRAHLEWKIAVTQQVLQEEVLPKI